MEVKLSKFYWRNLYGILLLGGIVEVLLGYMFWGDMAGDLQTGVLLMIGCLFLCIFVMFYRWKYLLKIKINEKKICSFLFGKLKCEVDIEKEIFYTIFKCNESNTNIKTYIAVSNEKFIYEEKRKTFWSPKNFIDCCNIEKIIIFPYEDKFDFLLDTGKWICIN